MDLSESLSGHSSADALRILHDELHKALREHEMKLRHLSWRKWFEGSFLHHQNITSVLHWTTGLLIVSIAAVLFISFGIQDAREIWLAVEALIILAILVLNVYFLAWDDKLRQSEHIHKSQKVLQTLHSCIEDGLWKRTDYINPHTPLSPCVTVQWTLRDCEILNIPCGLLVEGDIVLLRPGQVVPARCKYIGKDASDARTPALEFVGGDIYNPLDNIENQSEAHKYEPVGRAPLRPQPFLVLETPFVKSFRSILEKSLLRPHSVLNNERFVIFSKWAERRFTFLVWIFMLIVNALRYVFLRDEVGHWAEMFFVLPLQVIIPMLPLAFPIMWKLLDMWGAANIITALSQTREKTCLDSSHESFQSEDSFSEGINLSLKWSDVKINFFDILAGDSNCLPRTSNFLHAFGNITSFTCVDKKGVLSWPNPTAEKVFFLTTKSPTRNVSEVSANLDTSEDSGTTFDGENEFDRSQRSIGTEQNRPTTIGLYPQETEIQVLDLTQDAKTPCGLQFDDPLWKNHINSLKPLGLDILLNTCNLSTNDKYTEFADHVTCASLKREGAVPNMNRRCFCELARQIGFNDQAVGIFASELTLGMYRHVPQSHSRERLKSSRSIIKYKTPMPNMFSVVARDKNTGMLQLFSQGTADLLLDACSDYWDGKDLHPLNEMDRKKIYDFYHRTSMSSYCTAFSYRPLTQNIRGELNNIFIEVPEGNMDLFPLMRSPTQTRMWDAQSLDGRVQSHDYFHCSLDSLITETRAPSVKDIAGCFYSQCNQVFIGMITMQYQAKQDIVDLIEELDSACIRFVHFSKENELRSRVFSEKMGLEAGWNCHISLLSEKEAKKVCSSPSHPDLSQSSSNRASRYSSRHSTESVQQRISGENVQMRAVSSQDATRVRRCSAPGAISTEAPQVKFETQGSEGEVNADSEGTLCEASTLPEDEQSATEEAKCDSSDADAGARIALLEGQEDHILCSNKSYQKKVKSEDTSANQKSSSPAKYKKGSHLNKQDGENITDPLLQREEEAECEDTSTDPSTLHDPSTLQSEVIEGCGTGESHELNHLPTRGGGEEGLTTASSPESSDEIRRSYSVESFPASSYVTENTDSMTGALGLSNRAVGEADDKAKLPKGIENIRPHIENVDNVPLLVSLFTDCTSETTQEMLRILQENGEVVCCLGSSANIQNIDIFLQADCSIATEPQYPQICMQDISSNTTEGININGHPKPMELSALLHSIPCSLCFKKEEDFSIIKLIALGRHHCQRVRNTFLLLLMCQLSLTLLLVFNSLLLLPPALSPHLLLWLAGVSMPALSLTMMGNPLDMKIIKMAQGKNKNHITLQNFVEFVLHYVIRHVPSLLVCLLCHGFTLSAFCNKMESQSLTNATLRVNQTENCHVLLGYRGHQGRGHWNGLYDDYRGGLAMSQNIVAFQLVIYFVSGSLSFIHRLKHLWQKSPFRNRLWCIIAPILIVCQILYFAIDLTVSNAMSPFKFSLQDLPIVTWALVFLWPLVLIPGHELLKHWEIKSWVRYQKRARLDFGTKLGMNSPF